MWSTWEDLVDDMEAFDLAEARAIEREEADALLGDLP
jgi:hypothetical protein